MGSRETYRDTLQLACLIAGDESQLATMLEVPVAALVKYLLGQQTIPNDLFLRAVDIVLHSHQRKIENQQAKLDELLARISKRHGGR